MAESTRRRRAVVPHLWCENPYKLAADAYLEAGWEGPLPLPPKRKEEPPTGYTGGKNDWGRMTPKAVGKFKRSADPGSNICLWLPPGIIGIDVDHYDKVSPKSGELREARGGDDLRKLEADLGPLPPTISSSARSDGDSRIMYFRCPPDMFIGGKLSDAIELIYNGYRYVVVPPSYNPVPGVEDYYRWYAAGEDIDGTGGFDIPNIEDCAELPLAWVEYIGQGKNRHHYKEKSLGPRSIATRKVKGWIGERNGDMCSAMARVVREFVAHIEEHNPHDRLADSIWQLLCFSCEGHPGLADSIERLDVAWTEELSKDGLHSDRGGAVGVAEEFSRVLDGGVKKIMTRLDIGEFEGYPDECFCQIVGSNGEIQREINVTTYKLSEEVSHCYSALGTAEHIYQTAGAIVAYQDQLHPLNRASLKNELDKVVFTYRPRGTDVVVKAPVPPPNDLVDALLSSPDRYRELRALDRIARTPFYAREGGKVVLVQAPGYHPQHRTILDVDPEMVVAMSKVEAEPRYLKRALEMLTTDLLIDFPFVEPSDRSTIIAALVLPFVRELIDGPTPLHFIEAPSPRSGKSLLAAAISTIAIGPGREGLAKMTAPSTGAEWGKKILATLLTLPSVIVLDNIDGKLHSGDLAATLTEETISDRKLGVSEIVRPPNRALWLGTGNNLSATDEIARRIVPCRIDAGVESPHLRGGFRHTDLLGWTAANRPALVWAACVLVANWVAAGEPRGKATMGGFESWAAIVGGILEAAGVEGLLANQERFLGVVEEDNEAILEFVRAWIEWGGVGKSNHVTPGDFVQMPGYVDLVPPTKAAPSRAAGNYLRKYNGRIFLGLKISYHKPGGFPFWYLEPMDRAVSAVRSGKMRVQKPRSNRRVASEATKT